VKDPAKRTVARKDIQKARPSSHLPPQTRVALTRALQVFTDKHKEGKNAWFFSKLHF
jgi:hypothetical protein